MLHKFILLIHTYAKNVGMFYVSHLYDSVGYFGYKLENTITIRMKVLPTQNRKSENI
jgi:hypothetical protein